MKTNWRNIPVAGVLAVLGMVMLLNTGCVSVFAYDNALEQAKAADLKYKAEHKKYQELQTRHDDLKAEVDTWTAKLTKAIDRLDRHAKNWGNVRDDLIRLNIEQELNTQTHTRALTTEGGFIRLEE